MLRVRSLCRTNTFAVQERLHPKHQLPLNADRLVKKAFAKATISDLLPRKCSRTCEFPNNNPNNGLPSALT